MAEGTVKFFNGEKGFGFIAPDGGSGRDDDVFVHRTGIKGDDRDRALVDGQRVRFDTKPGRKGPEAFNVEVV